MMILTESFLCGIGNNRRQRTMENNFLEQYYNWHAFLNQQIYLN